MKRIYKGSLYYADLGSAIGSEIGGECPVLIVQNNISNKYSPTVIIAPISSNKENRIDVLSHVELNNVKKLDNDSIILLEHVRCIDKKRLKSYVGRVNPELMWDINKAIIAAFGIFFQNNNR